jgi:hypothetical protein
MSPNDFAEVFSFPGPALRNEKSELPRIPLNESESQPFGGLSMRCSRFVYSALLVTLVFAAAGTFGQTDRATITGIVSDSSGAASPGAQVTATNTDTSTSFAGVSNSDGIYTISGLPVGNYVLNVRQSGFKDHLQTDIVLITAQVLQLNIHLAVGSTTESVTVSGGVPFLETETTSVQTTIEQVALRDLPLDATGGRDAMNLLLGTTPLTNIPYGLGQSAGGGTQSFDFFAGHQSMTNSVYIDGLESTMSRQGQVGTPGLDALSEVQLIINPSDAEFGTGGGVEMFQIKSGTNKIHGSAFEFLQNEDLNANSWSNNYFLALCAPSDAGCRAANSRGFDRFNDYGASAGGPIWKNHTFIFGDFEIYKFQDNQLIPNSETVPTPQMLTGDFSQLLTGGAQQGVIPGPNGTPWINPCTGQPYEFGQIFDPTTQTTVNGVTCATPFQGNIIPTGRLSATSKQLASVYSKYYSPTISSRIYDNFPSLAGAPYSGKYTFDLKLDHTFSSRHHLSAGLDHVSWRQTGPAGSGGLNVVSGPLVDLDSFFYPTVTYRVIDSFSVRPTLLNILGIGFGEDRAIIGPLNPVNPSNYGIPGPATAYFPNIIYDNFSSNVANGVLETALGSNYQGYYGADAYQLQDTLQWTHGRHGIKVGGTFKAKELNTSEGANLQTLNFFSNTGGPTDPGLTPYVGFAFANQMLGDVESSTIAVNNTAYPRQKVGSLFIQDDYKAIQRLTLNLGLRWDFSGRDHEKFGHFQNFDPTAQNPLWAPNFGAWVFSKGPGTSFETNEDYHEFGPHLGGAYQVTNKLVVRASYGLFYIPDTQFNAVFGGGYTSTQTQLAFPTNQVVNNVPGSVAYNWDNGYPGINVLGPQNGTNTIIPVSNSIPMWAHPDLLKAGYSENWYSGAEYAITEKLLLNVQYVASRQRNLHDAARSLYRNSPEFSTYEPLLASGHQYDTIASPSDAAADNIPYPYPGFVGPAYAAIAPFPQLASIGAYMQAVGAPSDGAEEAFNSFVVEIKARDYHGLYLDFSYALAKITGSFVGLSGWANNWGDYAQSYSDWQDEKHWVDYRDQRNLAKGYLTYQLPFGRGKQWMSRSSMLLDEVIGGWEIGYNGSYGGATPMALVSSPYQLPGYFNCGCDRANFLPGLTASDMRNHFGGHLDLLNLNDPSNSDFNPGLFTSTSASAPFGNTPFTFNHWRWPGGNGNPPKQENLNILKHFNTGEHLKATIGAEFFDVFNRHFYPYGPNTAMSSATFGQITSVAGYRYGQLSGRVEW